MKIDGNIITADTGKEIYNIIQPEIYGKKIALGINDSTENWAERDETIEQPIVENIEDETN
jgi:hypothetical protein